MRAILKHEIRSYLHSLQAYLFSAALLVFIGVGAMLYNIQAAVANFEYVLQFVGIGMAIIIPLLTMKVFAEEKKQRTDQLLYTLPLRTSEIVLGKYLAMILVFLIPMLVVAVYPFMFSKFGDVYLKTSYGSMLAFIIMCCAMMAIGTFISSITENQGFAAGITIVILVFNYFSVSLAEYVSTSAMGAAVSIYICLILIAVLIRFMTKKDEPAYGFGVLSCLAVGILYWKDKKVFEGILPTVMKKLSLYSRFSDFVNGVFDVTSIVFYLTVIIFFLFLTVQSLEKRRYN